MIEELLQWVPNKMQLIRWVGMNRLKRALILGGFTPDDFKKRWCTTPVTTPHFPNAKYEIVMTGESSGKPKRMEYTYSMSSEDSDGYPRLLLALIRVKFPTLRNERFSASKNNLFLDTDAGVFYLDYDLLFRRDARRLSIAIQKGIQNQIEYQRKDRPRILQQQLIDALIATESYRNLCKAMKVEDL